MRDKEELQNSITKATRGLEIVIIISSLAFIILYTLLFIEKIRAKARKTILLQIALIWLSAVTQLSIIIAQFIVGIDAFHQEADDSYPDNDFILVLIVLFPLCYITQNWIFAFSYLKMALCFKFAFNQNSFQYQKEYKRRERLVKAIGIITYLFFLLIIISIFIAWGKHIIHFRIGFVTQSILNMTANIFITIIEAFSLYRIRKYTRMLVAN